MPKTCRVVNPKKGHSPGDLVNLTFRVHPEARRQLRIKAAEEEREMEVILRSFVYPGLGVDLPLIVERPEAS